MIPLSAQIEELEGLIEESTPGEWVGVSTLFIDLGGKQDSWESSHEDRRLVLMLRNAAPALLAERRRLLAENARLKSEQEVLNRQWGEMKHALVDSIERNKRLLEERTRLLQVREAAREISDERGAGLFASISCANMFRKLEDALRAAEEGEK